MLNSAALREDKAKQIFKKMKDISTAASADGLEAGVSFWFLVSSF